MLRRYDREEYNPWIEWIPAPELAITYGNGSPLPFAPGDYLIVIVTATDWSGGQSANGTLLFTDVTQNWQANLTVTAAQLGGTFVVGQSAERIVERPEVGGSFSTLANYVADPWIDATAKDVKGKTYSPGKGSTSYAITMTDGGTPISYVELFGTDVLWFFDENSAF